MPKPNLWLRLGLRLTALSLIVLVLIIPLTSAQIGFSVCDGEDGYGEHCINLGTIAHCDKMTRRSASVQGMWIFTQFEVFNTEDAEGIGEFLYQDRIGVPYHTFTHNTLKNGGCWRRIGYVEDYHTSALSLYRVTGLLSDSTSIIKESRGNSSFCLDKMFGVIKSFAILGNESWSLTTKGGDEFCVGVKDDGSFVPGLVLDTNDIGIAYGDICTAKKGCDSGSKAKMVGVDNSIKHAVYRREGKKDVTATESPKLRTSLT